MSQEEQRRKMGELIARAWADESFKQKLLSDTVAMLKEEGIEVPAGHEVRVLQNTDKVFHMVLPPKPKSNLSDDELDRMAEGGWAWAVSGVFRS